ncbi:MAG TPA: DUF2188 domain-containing protein [Noviherbaspirillum sp.]
MGSDPNAPLVICISPGLHGKWDVSEKGFEEPLATFDAKEDAYAYATELTQSAEGATVLVEDEEGFSPLPLPYTDKRQRRDSSGLE